jgi:hypothetical protein
MLKRCASPQSGAVTGNDLSKKNKLFSILKIGQASCLTFHKILKRPTASEFGHFRQDEVVFGIMV